MNKTESNRRYSLGLLVIISIGSALALIRSSPKSPVKHAIPTPSPEAVLPAFYHWSYQSEGTYEGSDGVRIRVYCKAIGQWEISKRDEVTRLKIESFRCNDQDIVKEESFHFRIEDFQKVSPEKIAQLSSSPVNALTLALAREIDLGEVLLPMATKAWTHEEQRLEGPIASVITIDDSHPLHWTKSIDGTLTAPRMMQHTLVSKTKGSSDSLGEPSSLITLSQTSEEVIRSRATVVSRINVGIEIHRVNRQQRLAEGVQLPLANQSADPENRRRELLKEWTQFWTDTSKTTGSKANHDALYARLKQGFRKDSSLVSEFRHSLDSLSPDSEPFKLLLGALAYSGNGAATDVIVESALLHNHDEIWQRSITPTLGLVTQPTEVSWGYLKTMATSAVDQDVRKAAELAMANEYHQGYRGEGAEEFLKGVMTRDASNPASILSMLDVIGNAGLEGELPRLETWAIHEDVAIRLATAESLRLMRSAPSEALALKLLTDASLDVRRMAAQSLQMRTLSASAVRPVLEALTGTNNHDEIMQSLLLEALYEARSLDPELRAKMSRAHESLQTTLSPSIAERWASLDRDW